MLKFTLRRFLWLAAVLLAVATITFILMHLVPGGPWDQDKPLAPQVLENLNKRYGLDQPLPVQFASYIWNTLHGNLGVSYFRDTGVTQLILQGLPATATLGIAAFLLALLVGISFGAAAALRHNSAIDYASVAFSTIFAATPCFVLGIVLITVLSVDLHWLPTGGWGSPSRIVMPALALAALPAAYISRVTRASVLEVMRQDYVRTAVAKGLPVRVVVLRHILRNALIPVLTITGPELAGLVTGSFIIELLFSIPGVGQMFVKGVFDRDYGVIMGGALFYASVVAILNLVVDLLYAVVDPRIRYE